MAQAIAIKGLSKVDILKNFERNFKELTKLEIKYLDVRNNPILPPNQYSPLFKTLAQVNEKETFLKPIHQACQIVKNNKRPKVFDCASALEVAVPIITNDEVIGIALINPARDKSSPEVPASLIKKKPGEKLTKVWKQLPTVEKKELEGWSEMLFDLLNYIFKQEYDFLVFSETDQQTTRTQESLHKALAFIKENYHQRDISLEAVAGKVYLSHYYFSHLFKRELKMTFIDYLTKVRLEAATKFLRNLKLNVNQIAYAVGYQDPNYFSKVFKRNLKVSPLEYRNRIFKRETPKKAKKYSKKAK